MHWLPRAAAACLLVALAAAPSTASAQPPRPLQSHVIDGPSATIVGLSGMSVARDGSGGIVYLKKVGGAQHVFVSALVGGVFQPPQQVDSAFASASSQPVIAAGNGGVLLVAFVNSGTLYVVDRATAGGAFGAPIPLASGASNPAIQMSNFGKAYLAFTVAVGSGFDVRAAYYYAGQWTLESAPLNASPGDNAGSGAGRPAVATAGDGIATVVWGEQGHIYARRVWATSPSIVFERADVPSLSGWSEVSASQPSAGAGGDSSYVGVTFEETLTDGPRTQNRVLMNRLVGSQFAGATAPDGLSTPGSSGADDPRIAVGELGYGLVTSARQNSNDVFAGLLGDNVAFQRATDIDTGVANQTAPDPVPATAGQSSFVVAWQSSAVVSSTEIDARYYAVSSGFGPAVVVSNPAFGTPNAASGLADGGDANGDLAIAWVQGSGGTTRIMAEQQYAAPGPASARKRLSYDPNAQPLVSWNPTNDLWGPFQYTVTVDGAPVTSTPGLSVRIPVPLGQGLHTWSVTATNPAGQQSVSPVARIFVDTVAPALTWSLAGKRKVGAKLRITIRYTDAPPGEPPQDASGVASVSIRWGDGTTTAVRPGQHQRTHAYRRAGRYRLTVTVKDRAGNRTSVARTIEITRVKTRRPKKPGKPGHAGAS